MNHLKVGSIYEITKLISIFQISNIKTREGKYDLIGWYGPEPGNISYSVGLQVLILEHINTTQEQEFHTHPPDNYYKILIPDILKTAYIRIPTKINSKTFKKII